MKNNALYSRAATLLLLCLSACYHDDDVLHRDSCKVTESSQYGKFTYDGLGRVGRVATVALEIQMDTGVSTLLSSFYYNKKGKLVHTVYTVNGQPNSEETYEYDKGRIVKVSFHGPNSPTGINRLSYDAAGRLIKYTVEPEGVVSTVNSFGYNAQGILTSTTISDGHGNIFSKTIVEPTGIVPSSEYIIQRNGLPYMVQFGFPWSRYEGGIGTVASSYAPGPDGELVLIYKETTIALTTAISGHLTERTVTDTEGNTYSYWFMLAGCDDCPRPKLGLHPRPWKKDHH